MGAYRISLPDITAKPCKGSLLVSKRNTKGRIYEPAILTKIIGVSEEHSCAFRRLVNFSELTHNHIFKSILKCLQTRFFQRLKSDPETSDEDHVRTRSFGASRGMSRHHIGVRQLQMMQGTDQFISISKALYYQ